MLTLPVRYYAFVIRPVVHIHLYKNSACPARAPHHIAISELNGPVIPNDMCFIPGNRRLSCLNTATIRPDHISVTPRISGEYLFRDLPPCTEGITRRCSRATGGLSISLCSRASRTSLLHGSHPRTAPGCHFQPRDESWHESARIWVTLARLVHVPTLSAEQT